MLKPDFPLGLPHLLMLFMLLAGCSSYTAKEPPAPKLEAMPHSQTQNDLTVAVEPYSKPEKLEELFGEDLTAKDVITLHIVVRNQADKAVTLDAKSFKLGLPGGEVVAARPGGEVAVLFDSQGHAVEYATTGIGLLSRFAGPFGGLIAMVVNGAVNGTVKGSQGKASADRQQDFMRKEFHGLSLGKDETVRGFLFFTPVPGTAPFDEASLILDVYDKENKIDTVKVPLKGLAYKTKPAEH